MLKQQLRRGLPLGLCLPLVAQAVELGSATVLSPVGQPLRAQIEVIAKPEELDSLMVRLLASGDKPKSAKQYLAAEISGVHVEVQKQGNLAHLALSSDQILTAEQSLALQIEVSAPSGKVRKEYRLHPKTGADIALGNHPVTSDDAGLLAPKAAPIVRPTAVHQAENAPPVAGTHTVKRGESLTGIAAANRVEGVSLDQMLLGIYRSNPNAFAGSNMNRLKTGTILRLPSEETVAKVSPQAAARAVKTHTENWQAYRERLATSARTSHLHSQTGKQTDEGKIHTEVQDKSVPPAKANQDVLKLSKTTPKGEAPETHSKQDQALAEKQTLDEANARVKQLEKNVQDMKALASIKSDTLAQAEAQAKKAPPPPPVPPKPVVKPANKATVPVKSEEDHTLWWVGLGAAALAAVGGGVFWWWRRRKKAANEDALPAAERTEPSLPEIETSPSGVPAPEPTPSTPAAEETPLTSVDFDLAEPENARDAVVNLAPDDVALLQEVDDYLASGWDVQAETLLRDALNKNPARHELRLKLMEILAKRDDVEGFEEHALDLYAAVGADSPLWARASELRYQLEMRTNPSKLSGGDELVEKIFSFDDPSTPEVPVIDTPVPPPPPPPAPTEAVDLDFDFDEVDPLPAPASTPPTALDVSRMPGLEVDLNLEDAAEPLPPVSSAPPVAPEEPALNFDFDVPEPPTPAALPSLADEALETPPVPSSPSPVAAEPLEEFSAEEIAQLAASLSGITAGASVPAAAPTPPSVPVAATPATGSSETVSRAAAPIPQTANPPAAEGKNVPPVADADAPLPPELEQHFGLAQAFLEMGDKDGARDALEDLRRSGNPVALAKAEALQAKLGD